MSLVLALECSTRCCSAALGDGHFLLDRSADRPREHHALLLPMVADLLDEAGQARDAIDAIAFGRGPGSFTGLRIAAGIAQGLGFALQRPLIPVSSLAALALAALEHAGSDSPAHSVRVAADAHMGEIFHAVFSRTGGTLRAEGTESLANVADFPVSLRAPCGAHTLLAGDAWTLHREILPADAQPPVITVPLARHALALALAMPSADRVPAHRAEPVYVRGVSAWKTREQQGRSG